MQQAVATTGYRGPNVCKIVGISYRQLDYWARTGLATPSVQPAMGSGSQGQQRAARQFFALLDYVIIGAVQRQRQKHADAPLRMILRYGLQCGGIHRYIFGRRTGRVNRFMCVVVRLASARAS